MSDPAVSLAFFDAEHSRHGVIRPGLSLLFERANVDALGQSARISATEEGFRAKLAERLELSFTPMSEPAELGGARTRVCRVEGSLGGARVACLGTATETPTAPAWEELDAMRALTAIFDADNALLAVARRPRGALGHGQELVSAWLLSSGHALAVEEARISTVYDAQGRQRSVGVELWLDGEDFPRRASGRAAAGTSLDLDGLYAHVAVFTWTMEGREGAGLYELTGRTGPPVAA